MGYCICVIFITILHLLKLPILFSRFTSTKLATPKSVLNIHELIGTATENDFFYYSLFNDYKI